MFAVTARAPKQSDVTPSCGFGLRTAARSDCFTSFAMTVNVYVSNFNMETLADVQSVLEVSVTTMSCLPSLRGHRSNLMLHLRVVLDAHSGQIRLLHFVRNDGLYLRQQIYNGNFSRCTFCP